MPGIFGAMAPLRIVERPSALSSARCSQQLPLLGSLCHLSAPIGSVRSGELGTTPSRLPIWVRIFEANSDRPSGEEFWKCTRY